ncbi:hypothetical protein C0992_005916 [Termitomyces sp. T32_za158]|nr:hypothetical protein C0992_005916 [Termitomyces sp. T32_za158]
MQTSHLERRDSNPPVTILAGGKEINTRAYATGGGKSQVIQDDQAFAGRVQGGGTRGQIYGTRDYGSGYPGGGTLRGTSSRGFPFYFWPVVWTNPFTIDAGDAYLHPTEYGLPDNTTRPGGPLVTLTYVSSLSSGTTFRILTDTASAHALISPLSDCSSHVYRSSSSPSPYLEQAFYPLPEQAIQHYRASSAVLTLDGYNNTAALLPQESVSSHNVLLPSGTDTALLRCLNDTIGSAVLLNDPPNTLSAVSILLITIGVVCAAAVAVTLLPMAFGLCICIGGCGSKCRRHRRRRQEARQKSSPSTALPYLINPIRAPPAAVIVLPLNGEPLSSGKAGDFIDDDEVASITKNAEAFAGTPYDDAVKHDSQTPWRWVSFGRRDSKGFEDIELKGKN